MKCNYSAKRILLFIFLFSIYNFAKAQNLQQEYTIDGNFLMVKADNLGNLYAINNQTVRKYLPNSNVSVREFSTKFIGNIDDISTDNPFKILILSKDFQKLVFLDNTLSKTNDIIDLGDININDPQLVCISYDAGFWIYDHFNNELKKFDKNLNQIATSGNINQVIGLQIRPNQILETSKNLILVDSLNGIFLFDLFGAYLKPIYAKNKGIAAVFAELLYFIHDNELIQYNMNSFSEKHFQLPISNILFFTVYQKSLYLLTEHGIKKYQLI